MKLLFFRFVLLCFLPFCFSNCSSNKNSFLNNNAINYAINELQTDAPCDQQKMVKFMDHLLESPLLEMDTLIAFKWFDSPIHKRYFLNENFVYVYYLSGYPSKKDCGYSDLFCIEFDKKGKFINNFIFFILEDKEAGEYWHSEQLIPVSYEEKEDNFIKYFYK